MRKDDVTARKDKVVAILATFCLMVTLFMMTPTSSEGNPLPQEPYPYTQLPIRSQFENKTLEPFALLSTFDRPSTGYAQFENDCVKYHSDGDTWIATRTQILSTVITRWMWKPVEGNEFVCECWNADPTGHGRTAMIIFRNGKVYYTHFPDQQYLVDYDPRSEKWTTVEMEVNYTESEIRTLTINGLKFEHLPIGDEPIGSNNGFWQLQFYLKAKGTVLIRSIEAA
jgi:hypothetical protein